MFVEYIVKDQFHVIISRKFKCNEVLPKNRNAVPLYANSFHHVCSYNNRLTTKIVICYVMRTYLHDSGWRHGEKEIDPKFISE